MPTLKSQSPLVLTKKTPTAEMIFDEFALGDIGEYIPLAKIVTPRTAIMLEAITTENSHIQYWQIFAWRPNEHSDAVWKIMPIPKFHEHSSSVDWNVTTDGVVRICKTTYPTSRGFRLIRAELLRGEEAHIYLY